MIFFRVFICALSALVEFLLKKTFSPIAPNFLSTCKFTTWFASSVLTLREFWENWMTPWGSLLPLMVILAVWRRGSIMAAPDGPMPAQKPQYLQPWFDIQLYKYYMIFPSMNSTLLYFILYVRLVFFNNLFHFNNNTHYVRLAKILTFVNYGINLGL